VTGVQTCALPISRYTNKQFVYGFPVRLAVATKASSVARSMKLRHFDLG